MEIKFDAPRILADCIKCIQDYAARSGTTKAVLGISGGKDSTVAAALCIKALGVDNVKGLLLPNGNQKAVMTDSIKVCQALGLSYRVMNMNGLVQAAIAEMDTVDTVFNKEDDKTKAALINLLPRLRMVMIRMWGQTNGYRMCGTGNLSEIVVGYYTKDGDNRCDFNPLAHLTSLEVVALGDELGLPYELVHKVPQDDLCGKTDEENLGVTYESIHQFIRCPEELDDTTYHKIMKLSMLSRHKYDAADIFIPQL